MTENSPEKETRKEAMKGLRKVRKKQIAAASARMKEQKKAMKAIKEALGPEGSTVPAVVEQTSMPSSEVFWYIAAMKKYGEVIEGDKDGAYFRYKLAAGEESLEEAAE